VTHLLQFSDHNRKQALHHHTQPQPTTTHNRNPVLGSGEEQPGTRGRPRGAQQPRLPARPGGRPSAGAGALGFHRFGLVGFSVGTVCIGLGAVLVGFIRCLGCGLGGEV